MPHSQNPFGVGKDDIVQLTITCYAGPDQRYVTATVREVVPRYGRYSGGHAKTALLRYYNHSTGQVESASIGWITAVLSRSSAPRRMVNIFADQRPDVERRLELSRGSAVGSIMNLVAYEMGALTGRRLDRPLNQERVQNLRTGQVPGLLRGDDWKPDRIQVRRKPFGAWVRAHAEQLMSTIAELTAEGAASEAEMAKSYFLEDDLRHFDDQDDLAAYER